MGQRILIVDDDPWILRMVGTMLTRRGHLVETASEGHEGLNKAQAFQPDLIISDVIMPGLDGWAFVRELRASPQMSLVPVIFLTALNTEEDRILGFRLGADDYLAKPFRFEELDLRVERMLRNIERMHASIREMRQPEVERTAKDGIGFKGDLGHLGVSAILTILEMERKSGILVLKDQLTARVFLRYGRVLDAFFDDKPTPRGAEAIYEMLTWKTGYFEFSALEVDMEDQIQTSTTHLLMEGARRIDEAMANNGA